jgi:hypothetical protein
MKCVGQTEELGNSSAPIASRFGRIASTHATSPMSLVFFAGRSSRRILDQLPHVAYTLLIINERVLVEKCPCLIQRYSNNKNSKGRQYLEVLRLFNNRSDRVRATLRSLQGEMRISRLFPLLGSTCICMHLSSPKHSSIARDPAEADLFPR